MRWVAFAGLLRRRGSIAPCRVPIVSLEVTAAPWSGATYATAMVSLGTSMPIKSVRDWDRVDLRVESCCGGSRRLWFRVRSPAFHRGAPSRHWKALCLGTYADHTAARPDVREVRQPCRIRRLTENIGPV